MCPFCNIILEYHSMGIDDENDGQPCMEGDEWYTCPQCNGMFEIEEVEGWGRGV